MADYSTIKGFSVETLASDPYTSSAAAGTWASGNAMPAYKYMPFEAGTQTANLQAGGATSPPANTNQTNTSFEYDGTSWATGNNMLTTRFGGTGFGTQTAAIAAGGAASPSSTKKDSVESYNGTSWTTSPASLGVAKRAMGGAGTQTAGLTFGGYSGPTFLVTTEKWDGSAWTEVGDMSSARRDMFALGIQTAALGAGGYTPSPAASVTGAESFDGTSWTNAPVMNTAREGGGSSGLYNDGVAFGGTTPPAKANTEYFDGTTWTEVADLGTARVNGGGSPAGTSSLALYAGGPGSGATEEFTVPSGAISVVQEGQVWYNSTSNVLKGFGQQGTGVWASGGTMPVNLYSAAYCGTQTAGVFTGGIPGESAATYLYDGSAWTTSPATLDDGRHYLSSTGIGTQTAAQIMGGESPAIVGATEQFDGSTWSEVNDLNNVRIAICGAGTQAAGLAMTGGHTSGADSTTYVESWDGTSWTNATAAPHSKKYAMGGGTQTSAFTAGGTQYPPNVTQLTTSETWNGSTWSEEAALNTGRGDGSRGASDGTSALIFGGDSAPVRAKTESWNGTAWSNETDLGTGRGGTAGNGTSMAAIAAGGNPPNTGLTEEWSVPNEIKTFTAS